MAHSTEVTWKLDGMTMEGTLVLPEGAGPFPAVILVAGSGPTDRDWCSPLLPGSNGSGRLLAEAFAEEGIASLRYDKRVAGRRAAENVPRLIGRLSMRSHLDELVAAVDMLAESDGVDPSRLVGLAVEEAAARYAEGKPMDLDPALPESVPMVLGSFEAPANLPFARELWVESACDLPPRSGSPLWC